MTGRHGVSRYLKAADRLFRQRVMPLAGHAVDHMP